MYNGAFERALDAHFDRKAEDYYRDQFDSDDDELEEDEEADDEE